MSANVHISITKQQVSEMPAELFDGDIILIDKAEDVAGAVRDLEQCRLIGFDTETRPSFTKGRANKVALLQLSTSRRCYLFRLNKTGIGEDICRLIENPLITKIGLSVRDDFNVMHRSSEVRPEGFIDLQQLVKDYGIQDISLQKIYAILFGKKISKSQRLTNWEAPTLTQAQQRYAATDAWTCLKIYEYLTSGMFDPESSPYKVTDTTQS